MAAVLEPRRTPLADRSLALLAAAAAFAVCWLARDVLIPSLLGVFAAASVHPLVARLERRRVPRPVAALAGTLVVVLAVAVVAALLWNQLVAFGDDLPRYEQRARALARAAARHFSHLRRESEQLVPPPAPGAVKVEPAVPWASLLLGTAQQAVVLAAGATVALFTLYFSLADGPRYAEKLLLSARTPDARGRIRASIAAIHRDVGRYLVNRAVLNAALGVVMGLALWLYGVQHAAIWGFTTALCHLVPYVGTALGMLPPVAMAVVQFDSVRDPLIVAAIYLVLVTIQGNLLDPIFLGKQLRMNSLAVFLGSLFWYWLWGPIGLFLAAPLLSAIRIVCGHVPRLKLVADLLGE